MIRITARVATALLVAVLAACGGGGGDGGGAGGGGVVASNAPPLTGVPTAVLTASQSTATSLAGAANTGAAALAAVQGINTLPFGVQTSMPTGVTTTEVLVCSGGGNAVAVETVANPNATSIGDSVSISLNGCVEAGATFTGTINLALTRFIDDNNLTTSFNALALTFATGGVTRGPTDFNGQIDITGGQVSFSYDVDGTTVIGNGVVTRNANIVTISSGTTRVNIGSGGFVELRYSNWVFDDLTQRPTSGTASVTAANGDSATVIVQQDGYHWTVTVNGTPSNYTVPF